MSDPTEPRDDSADQDSELMVDLFDVLEKHNVDEGVREMIMDIVGRWELEQLEAS